MKIGQRVKIKPLSFITAEFHNVTGYVEKIKSFTDHTDGRLYESVWIALDSTVRIQGGVFEHRVATFSTECVDSIPVDFMDELEAM